MTDDVKGFTVHALDVSTGEKLKSLESSKCKIGQLDVSDVQSIHRFKQAIGNEPVEVLLNIAGKHLVFVSPHCGA